MNQIPQEDMVERLSQTDTEAEFLKPAIAELLCTVPVTWEEYAPDALTDTQSKALFLLVAAGLVERRSRLRLRMVNHPVMMEATFTATGEYGGVEALENVAANLWHDWADAWRDWRASETASVPPFHCERLKPESWRLTDQGEVARDDLGHENAQAVYDFVLRRGFLAGRGPVRGHGALIRMEKQDSLAKPSELNIGNWDAGGKAFAEAFAKMFAAMEEKGKAASIKRKPKRRGRPKADYETVQREARIAAEWHQAREAGVYKGDFAKDHGMTITELNAMLDRVRKRNRPLE